MVPLKLHVIRQKWGHTVMVTYWTSKTQAEVDCENDWIYVFKSGNNFKPVLMLHNDIIGLWSA